MTVWEWDTQSLLKWTVIIILLVNYTYVYLESVGDSFVHVIIDLHTFFANNKVSPFIE